ncbi:pre-peptidase C-terminal domain-containing protein [Chloroflexota bacterium]
MNSRFRHWISLIAGITLLLGSSTAIAQEGTVGSSTAVDQERAYRYMGPPSCMDRQDEVVDSDGSRWFFSGNAGDVITIAANSTSFDTYLELRDASDNILIEDDDSGPGTNALIQDYVLPYTGEYRIVVRGYGGQTGPYTLSMPCVQEIDCGATVKGSVTTAAGDEWTFHGTKGCRVTIAMDSNSFDTYLELRDSSGSLLTQDDDSGPGNNALIQDFKLPYTGEYTIVARGYQGQTGPYTLSLKCQCKPPDQPIDCEKTIKDTVDDAAGDRWTFHGTAGCRVTIAMNSNSFDTYLELRDASNNLLAEDDDGGPDLNSLIKDFKLPYTGKYTIVARGYGGQTGPYTLSLTCPCRIPPLPCGKTIKDTVETAQGDQWTFSGTAGCRVTIAMNSSSFDTYLELRDASGKLLTEDDDGGTDRNSLILNFKLPYTGNYTIVARGYQGQTGPYTLSLNCKCGGSCRTEQVVKKGDTLYSIARRHGTTTQRLAQVNGLADPSVIYVGQILCIK